MNLLNLFVGLKKLKVYFDAAWTTASLICVPALVGLTGYWALGDGGGSTHLSSNSRSQVMVTAGDNANINPDVKLLVDSNRIVYTLKLVTQRGAVIYSYPDVYTSDTEHPEFGNMLLHIPTSVPNGTYELVADISYPRNPIKTNTLQVDLAKISVSSDPEK